MTTPGLGPGKTFDELTIGDSFLSAPRTISDADIAAFAELSGDHNPVHIDESFARGTLFRFDLPRATSVKLEVLDLMGRRVRIFNSRFEATDLIDLHFQSGGRECDIRDADQCH